MYVYARTVFCDVCPVYYGDKLEPTTDGRLVIANETQTRESLDEFIRTYFTVYTIRIISAGETL